MNNYIKSGEGKTADHQAIELQGNDGKTHHIWSRSCAESYRDGAKWAYKHGGLADVRLMILQDEEEGCWIRAKRVQFGRQADLATILAKHA